MIAKILSKASGFSGVQYNENKTDSGKSELLAVLNFEEGMENASMDNFRAYFSAMCEKNDRVKNPQFHAVLSCKGDEFSLDEIKDKAIQWLDLMGYSKQPCLIYGHTDTRNNHVHIVTARVDKDGKWIDDKFERIRSQRALDEIMGMDRKRKAKEQYDILSAYRFQNESQFRLLFEQAGWIVTVNEGGYNLVKGGDTLLSIDKGDVQRQINRNRESGSDPARRKQVSAMLYRYKAGLSHTELQALMKSKFGIELVFHEAKGKDKPYGLTIIDHPAKAVYKGGEVIRMERLLQSPDQKEKASACSQLADAVMAADPRITYRKFKEEMRQLGYELDKYGQLCVAGTRDAVKRLDEDVLRQLRYNQRLQMSRSYVVVSKVEADILGKVLSIDPSDIAVSEGRRKPELVYRYGDLMSRYKSGADIGAELKAAGMLIVERQGNAYLIDKKARHMVNDKELEYDARLLEANRYGASDEAERSVLSRYYGVAEEDIRVGEGMAEENKAYYEGLMRDCLNGIDIEPRLRQRQIEAFEAEGTLYLIDTKNHNIVSQNDFGPYGSRAGGQGMDAKASEEDNRSVARELLQVLSAIQESPGSDVHVGNGSAADLEEKKKKKRRRHLHSL